MRAKSHYEWILKFALAYIFIKYPVLNITVEKNVLLRQSTMLNLITVTTSLLLSFRKRNEIGNYWNRIIPNKRNKPTGIINNAKHEMYFNTISNDDHSSWTTWHWFGKKQLQRNQFTLFSSKNKKRSNQILIRKSKMNTHITTSHNHMYRKAIKNRWNTVSSQKQHVF